MNMSRQTKRKHVYNEMLQSDFKLPAANQEIAKILAGRGNNLHEVETEGGETFLVSMPVKFRKNVWVKRGDYVLIERILEGDKVKGEIVAVLSKDYIKFLRSHHRWPERFNRLMDEVTNIAPPSLEESLSSSSSDE